MRHSPSTIVYNRINNYSLFQIDAAQQAYLDQCTRHRYLKHRTTAGAGEVLSADEDAYKASSNELDDRAKKVYSKFLTIYSSFNRGWINHDRWIQELTKLRAFLLDANLINNRYLHFFELIQVLNTWVK